MALVRARAVENSSPPLYAAAIPEEKLRVLARSPYQRVTKALLGSGVVAGAVVAYGWSFAPFGVLAGALLALVMILLWITILQTGRSGLRKNDIPLTVRDHQIEIGRYSIIPVEDLVRAVFTPNRIYLVRRLEPPRADRCEAVWISRRWVADEAACESAIGAITETSRLDSDRPSAEQLGARYVFPGLP